jgi:ComF family protein
MIFLMYGNFIKPLLKDASKFVLDTLFPIKCLSCNKEGEFVCANCRAGLKQPEHQSCIVCQKPSPGGLTHPKCQTPFGADGLISIYDYHDDKVAKIIINGKYYFLPQTFELLGLMLAEKIKNSHPCLAASSPALYPIPLHPSRRRWRGFNQAEILAATISRQLDIACVNALARRKSTKTQKDLNKDQRKKNVESAFQLAKGADIRGQSLILVDDVTTTGSTLLEAAKVLKRNGAKTVWCLTVARD